MDARALATAILTEHARAGHHAGLREPFDMEVTHVNPTCGDQVTLRLRLGGDRVEDVSYEALGCTVSRASVSILSDLVIGGTVSHGLDLLRRLLASLGDDPVAGSPDDLGDAVVFAGVARHPARLKCVLLPWTAFEDAVARTGRTAGGVG